MSIVSSEAIVDSHTQASGSSYVIERHTDSLGAVHTIGPYLAESGFDINARLASHAVELATQLADEEAARVTA